MPTPGLEGCAPPWLKPEREDLADLARSRRPASACWSPNSAYAKERTAFGKPLIGHQNARVR